MTEKCHHILLTGPPRCGKTTVIQRVVEQLRHLRLAGFFTRELRRGGRRVGFEAVGLSGRNAPLASVESKSRLRVGKYGVELAAFEKLVRAELERPTEEVDLFVVDEIGKMESFSGVFLESMRQILDGNVPSLATIALKGGGFIQAVKKRDDVQLVTVTTSNRDGLPADLLAKLHGH